MAQFGLSGNIMDETGESIPFAKVYVKNSADLRTIADAEGHYELRLFPDEYFLVFSALGYEDRESYVTISDGDQTKDIVLFPTAIQELEDITVAAKKTNPGRDIMLKIVAKRDTINPWNHPHTVHGYIRATEKIDRKDDNTSDKKEKKKETETEIRREKREKWQTGTTKDRKCVKRKIMVEEQQTARNLNI